MDRILSTYSYGICLFSMEVLQDFLKKEKYGIDPTYLITGESSMKDFNLDYYVANSTKEQRNDFFDRVLAYLSKLIR